MPVDPDVLAILKDVRDLLNEFRLHHLIVRKVLRERGLLDDEGYDDLHAQFSAFVGSEQQQLAELNHLLDLGSGASSEDSPEG
jgi:hypothetical protein